MVQTSESPPPHKVLCWNPTPKDGGMVEPLGGAWVIWVDLMKGIMAPQKRPQRTPYHFLPYGDTWEGSKAMDQEVGSY